MKRGKELYCVILGDFISSRKMSADERDDTGHFARRAFDKINSEFKAYIFSGFESASGDSFEAVLIAAYKAPMIIQRLVKELYPVCLRISVGLGELYTLGDAGQRVNTMDGPAFHSAADALASLKKNKSGHWLQLSIQSEKFLQPLMDSALSLLTVLTERWTDKQREVAWEYERLDGNAAQLAEEMSVTVGAVHKHLRAADYKYYQSTWLNLERLLADVEDNFKKEFGYSPGYTYYLNKSCYLLDRNDLNGAETNVRKALDRAEFEVNIHEEMEKWGMDSSIVGDCRIFAPVLNKLGEILIAKKEYEKAEEVLKRSIAIQEGLPPGRDANLHALLFLGELYSLQNRHDEAREITQKGLAIEKALRGETEPPRFNWNF